MNWLCLFGIGEKRIIAQNHCVAGSITSVKKCWWLKVNTKPFRTSMWDGAKYPHIFGFVYVVDGKEYKGRRWVSYNEDPPMILREISVYYDPKDPGRYAVKM